jgi:hypothetical protein
MFFWVGDAAEAEKTMCVDTKVQYAMMQSKTTMTPCSDAPLTPETTAVNVAPTAPTPAAATPGPAEDLSAAKLNISGTNDLRLGASYFDQNDVDKGVASLSAALEKGETFAAYVYHRINGRGLLDEDMYLGRILITKDSFEFQRDPKTFSTATGRPLNLSSNFKVPLSKIVSAQAEQKKYGVRLSIDVLLVNEKGKEKEKSFYLYPAPASLIDKRVANAQYPFWQISCEKCTHQSTILLKLLEHFASGTINKK